MAEKESFEIEQVLQDMRREYWQGIEEGTEAAAQDTQDYLVFRLGGERYAVPSQAAREVLRMPRLVRVPRVGDHILGIFNLRGQVVAATELRQLLGLGHKEMTGTGQLVVVEAAGLTTALRAERVDGILAVADEDIEPLTEGLSHFPREMVAGQVMDEAGLLILLDLEYILSRPELVIDQKGE